MIIKNKKRRTKLTNGKEPWYKHDLSVDTGHMSHHNVPLPLKPRSPISPKMGEMLTSLDTIPKQILRQKGCIIENKKKLKSIKSHQKQEHESKRTKQLLQNGVKKNENGNEVQQINT
jgi:hypothetical protein